MKNRGNPIDRRRGETVRAVLAVVLKPDEPVPLEVVMQTVGLSQPSLLRHLALMQEAGKIRNYTTARRRVRVW